MRISGILLLLAVLGIGVYSAVPARSAASSTPFVPEVDTGGFVLYQPPIADIEARVSESMSSWTSSATGGAGPWTPDWKPVGFAFFSYEPSRSQYQGVQWIATETFTPTGGAEIQQYLRPGAFPGSGPEVISAPVLYVPVLGDDGAKLGQFEYFQWVEDNFGVSLERGSTPTELEAWVVTERS
ncbi:MAG: hypothetical protein AAF726_12320 [Planctomycetota bacterium]